MYKKVDNKYKWGFLPAIFAGLGALSYLKFKTDAQNTDLLKEANQAESLRSNLLINS